MNTLVEKLDINNIDSSTIAKAGEVVRKGGTVAFPTETVYGLGANGLDKLAAGKIYTAKGRPSDNPLILHISTLEELKPLVKEISPKAKALIEAFWPGPLTLVFKKSDIVPYETTGGLDTVAIRMPQNKIALELIKAAGVPIAAPSANRSGRPSPTTAAHVYEDLNGAIDMILDGGQVNIGLESTIIDVSSEEPMILRPGYITGPMAEEVIGQIGYDKVVLATKAEDIGGDYKPKAPGMKYRHYAPKAQFTMYSGSEERVVARINQLAQDALTKGVKVGIIATEESKDSYIAQAEIISLGSRENELEIAHNLYGALREFDSRQVQLILGETFQREGLGQAIMNRMAKAAGYQIEEV